MFLWCSGMDYSGVTANAFTEFSEEVLARLTGKRYELTEFGTIEFEDYYI